MMSDPRDFFEPAHKYLPEDVATDLTLASTTYTWWTRLRRLFDADREEIAKLKATVDALGRQICEYHDTNPLNETVVELERERDEWKALAQIHAEDRNEALRKGNELNDTVEALEAENRVVRELVENALDRLWVRDREGYQFIYDRCTWMMGEAQEKAVKVDDRDRLLARIAALTREYQDYQTIADHCTKVYNHFSGGRISKPFTLPEEVIAVAEQIQDEDFEEWGKEHLEVALEPIRKRLREWAAEWRRLSFSTCFRIQIGETMVDWIEETFKETP